MRKLSSPFTYCAFCNRKLNKSLSKPGVKAGVSILCKSCESQLDRELEDKNWRESDWWETYKQSYWHEENQRVRQNHWSVETLVEQEGRGYVANIPVSEIDGRPSEEFDSSVHNIVIRLYRTYGFGARRIAQILNDAYRIQISFQAVGYHLADIKRTGITPDPGAKFLRDWHQELRRIDRGTSKIIFMKEAKDEN